MAVYEKSYRPYRGATTAPRWRFLVLPRYAYREVFRSKLFVAFFAFASFIFPLALGLLIYLPHNLSFLDLLQVQPDSMLSFFRFDGRFFLAWFMVPAGMLSFLLALVVGPALVSADLRNNGLPLYLSRPVSRTEYVLGKMAVLIILLSLITWVPGLLLFLLQSCLAGFAWFGANLRIGAAILLGAWIWILFLCLLTLALSAHLKWKPATQAAMFGAFFVASMFAGVVNFLFKTRWGSLFDVGSMMQVIYAQLFGVSSEIGVPAWAAWLSILTVCGGCLLLLSRRIRAYEVVRS
jgi:ABC-2 type transport system permease protein